MHGIVVTSTPKGCQSTEKADGLFPVCCREAEMIAGELWDDWKTPAKQLESGTKGISADFKPTNKSRSSQLGLFPSPTPAAQRQWTCEWLGCRGSKVFSRLDTIVSQHDGRERTHISGTYDRPLRAFPRRPEHKSICPWGYRSFLQIPST